MKNESKQYSNCESKIIESKEGNARKNGSRSCRFDFGQEKDCSQLMSTVVTSNVFCPQKTSI